MPDYLGRGRSGYGGRRKWLGRRQSAWLAVELGAVVAAVQVTVNSPAFRGSSCRKVTSVRRPARRRMVGPGKGRRRSTSASGAPGRSDLGLPDRRCSGGVMQLLGIGSRGSKGRVRGAALRLPGNREQGATPEAARREEMRRCPGRRGKLGAPGEANLMEAGVRRPLQPRLGATLRSSRASRDGSRT